MHHSPPVNLLHRPNHWRIGSRALVHQLRQSAFPPVRVPGRRGFHRAASGSAAAMAVASALAPLVGRTRPALTGRFRRPPTFARQMRTSAPSLKLTINALACSAAGSEHAPSLFIASPMRMLPELVRAETRGPDPTAPPVGTAGSYRNASSREAASFLPIVLNAAMASRNRTLGRALPSSQL
jgi:hypothetical protein